MTANAQAVSDPRTAEVEAHPSSEPANMLAMIERMAVNPNIDTDKLERLIAMKKDMDATTAKLAFNAALVAMQPHLPAIDKKGKSNNGDYGKWEDIQSAILPVLGTHGFALSFKTSGSDKAITVTAILRHSGGHDDETSLTLPADNSGSKNSVQAVGSSVSYGKRYTASALLNLRIGGEDDDGRKGPGGFVTEEQLSALQKLASEVGGDVPRLCAHFGIDALPNLPAAKFAEAKRIMEMKRARK